MKNIHIENSYNIWKPSAMDAAIMRKCNDEYGSYRADIELNRTYRSMYIEWWLHNIGYYITKPFCFLDNAYKTNITGINLRCKDVDLEEHKEK